MGPIIDPITGPTLEMEVAAPDIEVTKSSPVTDNNAVIKKKTDMVVGNVIGSNVLNITLVVPIIGFFSNVQLDSLILSRDFFVMIIATILFVIIGISYSSKAFGINSIKLVGLILVSGYLIYILSLSSLI